MTQLLDNDVSIFLYFCAVEPGLSVCAGGVKRLLWPPCWDLHPRAGHELPGTTPEDQDLWLPEPLHSRRGAQGPAQILPQQIHSGKWLRASVLDICNDTLNKYYGWFEYIWVIWGENKQTFHLFSQVFVDQLTSEDMEFIGDSIFPNIDNQIISKMVQFNNRVGRGVLLHWLPFYLFQNNWLLLDRLFCSVTIDYWEDYMCPIWPRCSSQWHWPPACRAAADVPHIYNH